MMIKIMTYIKRSIESPLLASLNRGKSILLLGARQTGKTTLMKHLNASDIHYTLLDPERRIRFEQTPTLLKNEIEAYKRQHPTKKLPLVTIDEVQKVPALMDMVQLLIDNREAQFILTGSSVRKLRRHPQFNLLPGRVVNFHIDPFNLSELATLQPQIESLLAYGTLPSIYLEQDPQSKQIDLESYVTNYLEEEIRGESLARQLGTFAKFLEFAALSSGQQLNVQRLSQEIGISRHTINDYLTILEDCLIAERIEPITASTSKRRLSKSPKYLFFDMGIRRIAAREGATLSHMQSGTIFEQYIGLELLRHIRLNSPAAKLSYWRDHAGPEVDYVVESNKRFLPIEVKWTTKPMLADAKHLLKFMQEYPCYDQAYLICQCERPILLDERVMALPWQELSKISY